MPRGNIHYYIKITIHEDWQVVTLYEVEGIDPLTRIVYNDLHSVVTKSCQFLTVIPELFHHFQDGDLSKQRKPHLRPGPFVS